MCLVGGWVVGGMESNYGEKFDGDEELIVEDDE